MSDLKLTVKDLEEIEDKMNISFFDIVQEMSDETDEKGNVIKQGKKPTIKLMRVISEQKNLPVNDITEMAENFGKVINATFAKKN